MRCARCPRKIRNARRRREFELMRREIVSISDRARALPFREISKENDMKSAQHCENKYFNRELSWLAFNRRVLNLCSEPSFPVLERLRFLSIVSNNLDEFFEIRVAGLEQQLESGVPEVGFDGLGPREQLRRISEITSAMNDDEYRVWATEIMPALRREKIFFKTPKECSAAEKAWLKEYFDNNIYPALTPLAVDPAHPFPHLRNKGLYVLLQIANPAVKRAPSDIAIVPIPPILPRFIKMDNFGKEGENRFAYLSDTVKYFAEELFPGYKVRNAAIFRITRNSDLYFDEEETENLLQTIENELHNRRKGAAVRLEIESCVSETALRELVAAIDLDRFVSLVEFFKHCVYRAYFEIVAFARYRIRPDSFVSESVRKPEFAKHVIIFHFVRRVKIHSVEIFIDKILYLKRRIPAQFAVDISREIEEARIGTALTAVLLDKRHLNVVFYHYGDKIGVKARVIHKTEIVVIRASVRPNPAVRENFHPGDHILVRSCVRRGV